MTRTGRLRAFTAVRGDTVGHNKKGGDAAATAKESVMRNIIYLVGLVVVVLLVLSLLGIF